MIRIFYNFHWHVNNNLKKKMSTRAFVTWTISWVANRNKYNPLQHVSDQQKGGPADKFRFPTSANCLYCVERRIDLSGHLWCDHVKNRNCSIGIDSINVKNISIKLVNTCFVHSVIGLPPKQSVSWFCASDFLCCWLSSDEITALKRGDDEVTGEITESFSRLPLIHCLALVKFKLVSIDGRFNIIHREWLWIRRNVFHLTEKDVGATAEQ